MAVEKLSDQFVNEIVCPEDKSKLTITDSKYRGLILEVRPTGTKTFYLRYRSDRGKTTQLKLARACDVSVGQVRMLEAKIRNDLAMGIDPQAEKKKRRNIPKLKDFALEKYLPFAKTYKRSWRTDEGNLRNHILPRFGHMHMDQISKRDIISFHTDMLSSGYRPSTANRPVILVSRMFNLAIEWETPGVTVNPANGVPLVEENNKQERFLTQDETQRLSKAIQKSRNKTLPFIITMLLLTGARKSEVLNAEWQHFDFDKKSWLIPLPKSGKARHVPLSDGVINLLDNVRRIKDCPYVFPNPKTGKPYIYIFHSWDTARKKAGLGDVQIHDLRDSCASFLINAGLSLYVVQKILGHSQIQTTQRYAHLSQETLLDAANQLSAQVNIGM